MRISPDGSITDAAKTFEDAKRLQEGVCRHCDLSGQVTIYHKKLYTGGPTAKIIDHNGKEREVRVCITAHCRCEVGKWMRSCTAADVKARIPELAGVGIGILANWTPLDPTLPDWTDDVEVDWKAARLRFAQMGARAATKVYPESDGNRRAAYAEMSESLPVPAGLGWKSMPPVPNVAEVPEEEFAEVPF